ncbi:MAG TPA: hypothetical protein VF479_05135 [Pseudolysinimonas sp.]
MTDDYHPELAEYEPGDARPSRSVFRRRVMRVMVVLGLTALILPGVLVTIRVQETTAAAACRYVVQTQDTEAIGSTSRFELTGPDGPGWYCYAVRFGGTEILLRSLGLIPGLSPQRDDAPGIPA